MTRTGLSARLAEHKTEPYVLVNPSTALKYAIRDGEMAKISNYHGECLARAEVTNEISDGQLFVPIHWNGVTAKNSKPCDLIAPFTDPYSGQPEFKHTPVAISACQFQSKAIFATKAPIKLNELDYWARQKTEKGYLYRIESRDSVDNLAALLRTKLSDDDVRTMSVDTGNGTSQHRFACEQNGELVELVFVQAEFEEWQIGSVIDSFDSRGDQTIERMLLGENREQKSA
jgi:assimilatory nitrate reductase catalytic subunit